jgi:hypothetical protein
VVEAVSSLDSVDGAWVFISAITEAASSTEQDTAITVFSLGALQSALATDASTSLYYSAADISEQGSASDLVDTAATLLVSGIESLGASDSVSYVQPNDSIEAAFLTDSISVSCIFANSILEAVHALDEQAVLPSSTLLSLAWRKSKLLTSSFKQNQIVYPAEVVDLSIKVISISVKNQD